MKERITFIHNTDGDFDAERLIVAKTSVQIKALKASREERLTLSPHELPQEDNLIEIPGNQSHHRLFSTYHYHDFSPSLRDLVTYLQKKICPEQDNECSSAAKRLEKSAYLDIDYNAGSREFILTSFHHESPDLDGWNEDVKRRWNSEKTEVGLFTYQQALEPEELSFGGYLTVISEDKKPRPTRFSFPSRHHPVPLASGSSFLTTFPTPTGLHPTLRLTFPHPISPPARGCALHTYLTLPSSFFVDKYQFSSPNFLAAKNLLGVRALSGETDLEAPEWVAGKWGSMMLLELAHHAPNQAGLKTAESQWHVDIPLHLRYLPPAAGGATSVDIPWPIVFWACPAKEGIGLNGNPFDRINLGYEVLFDPSTTFYHFQPQPKEEGGSLIEQVQVPVMDLQESRWVESGTVGVILLGALWVMWKLLRVSLSDWRSKKKTILPKKVL
ncbi:MAG: hypothetical protein L6R38_000828 [Xanthoria sp. 2 TBL-2021]|nr:MAG: hypothetical protein L6R38_000828 [Xanthoria sp. 2 TBL-2021]